MKTLLAMFVAVLFTSTAVNGATERFNNRSLFESSLSIKIVDDYENPAYVFRQNNADMSSVLNETKYFTTGFSNLNLVTGPVAAVHTYCAGCNGSFQLDFKTTSISANNGVAGVGFEFGNDIELPYHAIVTFGDGSTAYYGLPVTVRTSYLTTFFGIVSDLPIASIHLGLSDGGATRGGRFLIDNLTIGQVIPEPSSMCLCIGSIVLLGIRRRG